jgi:RNA polymerase sigma-70 factor (ECF subfamily)
VKQGSPRNAAENLLLPPLVWTEDMRMTSSSTDDRETAPPAQSTRKDRFLAGAGPSLDRAYRLAGLFLGNAHEAEDAVQDALVIGWQSFDRLRDGDRFAAWFDRILVNGCRDRLRRRSTVRFVAMDPSIDPAASDPFRELIERDALLSGLEHLTPDERIVIVLRFWADLPLDEIADRLGWPLGSVKSRLHRALDRMRAGLAAERTEGPA